LVLPIDDVPKIWVSLSHQNIGLSWWIFIGCVDDCDKATKALTYKYDSKPKKVQQGVQTKNSSTFQCNW
jgi:hypothetical protein